MTSGLRGGRTEQIWIWYCACVVSIVVVFGADGAAWEGTYAPASYALLHVGIAVCAALLPVALRTERALRIGRSAFALCVVPVVFFSMALVLPGLHPEPYEWTWIASDRWLFGGDPTRAAQALLSPWSTELLQWCYASFYGIPIAVAVAAGLRGGAASLDRCRDLIVFWFFVSYLGYFLWPTLPPYRFLHHPDPLEGVWAAGFLNAMLESAELHRWNCFPSGHTMLSVLSLVLAWRHVRAAFWCLLPVVVLLVVGTIALRYHYATDVFAGLCGVPIALWLGRRVLP